METSSLKFELRPAVSNKACASDVLGEDFDRMRHASARMGLHSDSRDRQRDGGEDGCRMLGET